MSSIEHYPLGVIHPPPLPVSNDSHYLETPYAQGSSHVNWSRPFLPYPNTSPIATHSNGSADSRTAIISQGPYDQPFSEARRRSVNQRIMDAGEQGWFSFIEYLWRQWNLAVNNKETWPRIVYCMGGVIFIGAWLGLMATFASSEKQYQRHNIDERPHVIANPRLAGLGVSRKCWFLEGRLQRFDPATRTLSINWVLKTVKNRRDSIIGEDLEDIMRIGIFQDQDLVPVDSNYAIVTGNATKIWDFRVANESAIPTAIVGTSQWDSFITDIAMGQRKKANAMRQPQWGFPFDLWSGDTSFVANIWDKSLNINRTDAFGIEIDGIVLVDSLMNWRISTEYHSTCSNVTENPLLVGTTVRACGLHVKFKARRTGLVKFACVVAVIINWFSTVFIFIMTCEGVIMRRFEVITSPQLLAVCFTALFALPSVRSILPGAPEFGSLVDLVGIVPNVIIISVCTTLVAVATLRHLVERNDQETLREPSNT